MASVTIAIDLSSIRAMLTDFIMALRWRSCRYDIDGARMARFMVLGWRSLWCSDGALLSSCDIDGARMAHFFVTRAIVRLNIYKASYFLLVLELS
jgi:hypothetical protein